MRRRNRDLRSERRNADTGTDEKHGLVVQEVLGGRAKRSVDHDTGKNAVNGRVRRSADDLALGGSALVLLVEIAPDGLGQRLGKVTDDTDMNGDVVLFGRTTQILEPTGAVR